MKVAFCIPTTSTNRNWKSMSDSFLLKFNNVETQHEISYFIGFDKGDPLFSLKENQKQFDAKWIECDFEKGHVTAIWNRLYKEAIESDKFDYYWLVGDDILYVKQDWLNELITELKKTNGIGIAGMHNGNPFLPMTQFLVSYEHFKLFGFAYPPEIKNWYCDDWITEVYPSRYVHFRKDLYSPNIGGQPRYLPDHRNMKWKSLVVQWREQLVNTKGFNYSTSSIGNRFEKPKGPRRLVLLFANIRMLVKRLFSATNN